MITPPEFRANSIHCGHTTCQPRHAGVAARLAAAQREVLVVSSLSGQSCHPVLRCRGIDHANLLRGVRYRMLFPDHARTAAGLARGLGKLAQAGAEIRTLPAVPIEALVVDVALAILPNEHNGKHDVVLLRMPSVVAAITELVNRLWPAAVPLLGSDPPETTELPGRDRDLLDLLCAGYTDETAAAALGISVRTVRRMVSGLMNRLGARSRFQAGVKAADRGWLTGRAS